MEGNSMIKSEEIAKTWTKECEELLAEWSEKASCYRWLHGRCEKIYRRRYHGFSIPVIILSTLTGAVNVGMDSFVPPEKKSIASAIVGGVNILAGIISTLQNFLKVAELMEAHRIAGVAWGKLQRNIAIELALDPSRRIVQTDFLKMSRLEYDRLLESSPIIDDRVIDEFNKRFKNYKAEISVPSICNGLDKCTVYKINTSIDSSNVNFNEGIESILPNDEKSEKVTNIIISSNDNDPENNIQDHNDHENNIQDHNNPDNNNNQSDIKPDDNNQDADDPIIYRYNP